MTSATTATPHPITPGKADALLKKYATQLTATLGGVVGVTGVMMFYRVYKGEVETMHEWLGLAFVVALVLHIARHRKLMASMLTQNRMRILTLFTALIAAAFIVFSPAKQGNPIKLVINAVLRAPINDLAPVLGVSADEAISRLTAAGAQNAKPTQSITTVARASNTDPMKLLSAVVEQAESVEPVEKDR